jgi:hypothetical protein
VVGNGLDRFDMTRLKVIEKILGVLDMTRLYVVGNGLIVST